MEKYTVHKFIFFTCVQIVGNIQVAEVSYDSSHLYATIIE